MANFGIGIGSFLDGFVKGANVRNDWDRQAKSDAREDRRLDMAETRMAQDKEASDRNYQLDVDQFQHTKSIGDFNRMIKGDEHRWSAEDRAAEAPVKAAERQQRLQGYQDTQSLRDAATAGYERSIGAYQDAVGKAKASVQEAPQAASGPQFTFNGQTFKTRQEAEAAAESAVPDALQFYTKYGVPQIQDAYLKSGDPEKASAYGKWAQNEYVQAGMQDVYRLYGAMQLGDWGGANRHLNSLFRNPGYMDLSNIDGKISPITDGDGNPQGIRIDYKDRQTGQAVSRDITDMGEFQQTVLAIVRPEAVFEHNTRQLDAAVGMKQTMAEENYKLGNQILLEQAKAEAKRKGLPDPEEELIRKRVADLERTDMQFAALSGPEKVKRAMEDLFAIRSGARQGRGLPPFPGTAAQPAPNVLRRPEPAASASGEERGLPPLETIQPAPSSSSPFAGGRPRGNTQSVPPMPRKPVDPTAARTRGNRNHAEDARLEEAYRAAWQDLLGRNAFPPEVRNAGRDAMARYAQELARKRLAEGWEASGSAAPTVAPAPRARGRGLPPLDAVRAGR